MIAARDGLSGDRQRLVVGGESEGRAAMDVARELVEQDDERQSPFWRFLPMVEGAVARFGQRLLEAHRKLAVEGRIAREPAALPGGEPEIEDLLRRHFRSSLIWVMMKSASASTWSRSKTGTCASPTAPLAAIATTVGSSPASFG